MKTIGTVESLWRYPVKSMCGEELDQMFAGYGGVYGDRVFAFESSASAREFPFFTGRQQHDMIRYRPQFRSPSLAKLPGSWTAGAESPPGPNPIAADRDELMIDIRTPEGETFAIDDPALIDTLCAGVDDKHKLKLLRSDKALTDAYPISIFAVQSARQLGEEAGMEIDKRRFRANIYLDLASSAGFAEDKFVGRSLRLGQKVIVSILKRDARCMMITLDPDTAQKTPALLKKVVQAHEGFAGVYGAVIAEGLIEKGDPVELLD